MSVHRCLESSGRKFHPAKPLLPDRNIPAQAGLLVADQSPLRLGTQWRNEVCRL